VAVSSAFSNEIDELNKLQKQVQSLKDADKYPQAIQLAKQVVA